MIGHAVTSFNNAPPDSIAMAVTAATHRTPIEKQLNLSAHVDQSYRSSYFSRDCSIEHQRKEADDPAKNIYSFQNNQIGFGYDKIRAATIWPAYKQLS